MIPLKNSILLFSVFVLLSSCGHEMSTREPALTRIAVMEAQQASAAQKADIHDRLARGNQLIATIEDTANQRYSQILTLDTAFGIKYREVKREFRHTIERGMKVSQEYQQVVQDRISRLKADGWHEPVAFAGQTEDEDQRYAEGFQKSEAEIALALQALQSRKQQLDTMPVPRPKPKPYVPPQPVYQPPVVPAPQEVPTDG